MDPTAGPVLVGAALLVLAGAPKLARPQPTVVALRSVGWVRAASTSKVRLLATVEILVGVAALLGGGPGATAAVATTYAGFCAFLVVALRRPAASCGCAGRRDAPPTAAHLVMNAAFVAFAVAAAFRGVDIGVPDIARAEGALAAVTVVGYAGLATWLGWLVLTVLPTVRPVRSS